ncbi:16S rRNA (guanine(527)-N(7))-methyltransferase RsmG [Mycoplasma phocoenae]|uniref:Ribosomal RNA small subunit methyltransferase G n=1 Tax=Mycoplasma phocoenae TaxID=754517 RepID=A0A858U680_9MOLU|nr:16S rRNA (guanine(527)-N(7))-methyltransferase RsmG [Mycoplasma phocoenae]QJG66957.1 16S rRNA (guanine(527)-N(7))-methyltransferase RsmG [Mycoplasma phocoenae]
MLTKTKISQILNNYSINISEEKLNKLVKYYELIETKNKVMNLTGFKEEELVIQGLVESILCLNKSFNLTEKEKYKLVDIGAGAGFPSVPYFIVNQEKIELTIIEPLKKRCVFLQEVSDALNLNISIINERAENIKSIEVFDLITARAVTHLKNLIEITCQLGKINSQQVFIKGDNADKEIKESQKIINVLNVKVKSTKFNTQGIRNNTLVSIIKNKSAPKLYPRAWSKIISDK